MEAKRITKTDVKYKELMITNKKIIDFETGEEVNLIQKLFDVYGEKVFTLTCTTKDEEILEV